VVSPGFVEKLIGPRSYKVRVDGVVYRRNRRQLQSVNERVMPPNEMYSDLNIDYDRACASPQQNTSLPESRKDGPLENCSQDSTQSRVVRNSDLPVLRRSERARRSPSYLKNYVS